MSAVTPSAPDPETTTGGGFPPTAPPPAAAGRYALDSEIGHGGMGAVYRATDTVLRREVAVKLLLDRFAPDSAAARRFFDEAHIAAQLQHPGIPPVHDLGTLPDGRPFLAMKLIRGETLDRLLKASRDPAADRGRFVAAFEKVCEAVGYAHAHGVIHRDLNPKNVMVGAFGEVQVMDWGLAKVLSAATTQEAEPGDPDATAAGAAVHTSREADGGFTQVGAVLGTPAYMAPEQAIGAIDRLDARTDVFGLGGMLAAVLTGHPPFVGETAESTRQMAARGKMDDCFARLDGCGAEPELVALCKRCMAAEQADRPADAGAVAKAVAALRAAADERARRAELDRVAAEGQAAEQRQRRRVQLTAAAAAGLLLAGGGGFVWWQDRQAAARATEAADRERADRERQDRNADAVAALLDQVEAAVRAGDPHRAEPLLTAADRRLADGGADAAAERQRQLRADLAVLHRLDQIDLFRWNPVRDDDPLPADADRPRSAAGRIRPDLGTVAERVRAALRPADLDPAGADPEPVAARAGRSTIRDRLVAAYDLLLLGSDPDAPRAVLQTLDPDPFRDAVRDATVAGDQRLLNELAALPDAAEQSSRFFAQHVDQTTLPDDRRRELLEVAVRRRPDDPGLLLELELTYRFEPADVERRLRWAQAAVAAAPRSAFALSRLAHCYRDLDQDETAVALLREVIRLAPTHAPAHNSLGSALRRLGRLEAAAVCHREAVRLDPGYAYAHRCLGWALSDLGEHAAAVASAREALRLEPDDDWAHAALGVMLEEQGELDAAADSIRQAIRLNPADGGNHGLLGSVFRKKGDLKAALASCREAVRLDPNGSASHMALGNVLLARRDAEAAAASYREAVRLDPRSATAHSNLGLAYATLGRPDDAVVCHRTAIRLEPKLAIVHTNYGGFLLSANRYAEAVAVLRTAARLNPRYGNAVYGLGVGLVMLGEWDEGVGYLDRAVAIDPSLAENVKAVRAHGERLRPLRAKLPAVLAGRAKPASGTEAAELAELCVHQQRFAAAARLYAEAFERNWLLLGNTQRWYVLPAVRAAARAGAGEGVDPPATAAERVGLRDQAHEWMGTLLTGMRLAVAIGVGNGRANAVKLLGGLRTDESLAALRPGVRRMALPAAERERWDAVWAEMDLILAEARRPIREPAPNPRPAR